MFTNCPDCARQFRIRASQLAQAEGLVQCGFCGHQFNALERLYDKPLVIANDLVEQEQHAAEPEFFIPELEVESKDSEQTPETSPEPAFDMEIDIPKPEPEPGLQKSASPVSDSVAASEKPVDEYPFPEELAVEEKPKAGIVSRLLWSFGVLLLLLAGTAQAAWFNRDILLSRYPQYLPQARQVCQHFKCTLIRNRNISAIKLLNRDVRIHPRYEDALLVNATMINLSNYTQRYPLVLLSLFNTDGKVIAYRQVAPKDYLDSSMDIEDGMAADMPVHFVLEVADSGIGAVSFEFDFL
jgi:predicted Zn finger-like uncharacterized protein